MRRHVKLLSAGDRRLADSFRIETDAPIKRLMTAAEAREIGRRELCLQLESLLVETRGNIAEIGRRIGKDRSTVRYHLRRFGMLGEGGSAVPRSIGAGSTSMGKDGSATQRCEQCEIREAGLDTSHHANAVGEE